MNLPCKVTLAMPVYNVEKYIERALLSALNQTFESIEYLVIDDKGQDESMNIVVLAGGTSTEREISIVTGTGVCKALRKKAIMPFL